jgi:hypothetical protein
MAQGCGGQGTQRNTIIGRRYTLNSSEKTRKPLKICIGFTKWQTQASHSTQLMAVSPSAVSSGPNGKTEGLASAISETLLLRMLSHSESRPAGILREPKSHESLRDIGVRGRGIFRLTGSELDVSSPDLAAAQRFRRVLKDVFLDLLFCFLYKTENAISVSCKKHLSKEVHPCPER